MNAKKLLFILFCLTQTAIIQANPIEAARGVVQRRIPQISSKVVFKMLPDSAGWDIYETSASDGKLTVKGTSAVAMCRGLYDYLKQHCGCLMTWEGSQFDIPKRLPDQAKRHVAATVKFRQHFNVVTFGYTTAFWNWKRWEFEIDWMAMHGINMPLAMTGQEKIWQKIWKAHYGLTDTELDDYFTGPAFLPWHRMGNIYGNDDQCLQMVGRAPSGRSLPQSWIDRDASMQQKILNREHELGMKPIIPGFSGFIPRALKTKYPNLDTWQPTSWNSACKSSLALSGLDAQFSRITQYFIDEYKKFYGNVSHHYLIDLFNEIDPPANIGRDQLATIAQSVYQSLITKDPAAIWVTQGWCFSYQKYWQNTDNTRAYLSQIPNDKMIIIDLQADNTEVYRSHPQSIAKKQVIWTFLNDNWGQHTTLEGNLDILTDRPRLALKNLGSHLVGLGNSCEGIEHNSVCFELLYDNAWGQATWNATEWLSTWAQQRYNTHSRVAVDIWKKIYAKFYKGFNDGNLPYMWNPGAKLSKVNPDSVVKDIITEMLAAPVAIKRQPLFERDLVDVVKCYVGRNMQTAMFRVQDAIKTKSKDKEAYRTLFDKLMTGLDNLLYTQEPHRLSRWIANARKYVAPADADYLEKNSKLLLTTWVSPSWTNYARREWSGLVGQCYRERWNRYFDSLEKGTTFDNNAWTNHWCAQRFTDQAKQVDVIAQTNYLLSLIDKLYTFH